MSERFILQHSAGKPSGWVLTDTENGIVIEFEEHRFNDTQKVTLLEDVPQPSPTAIARAMREAADYLATNHYKIAMP